MDASDARLAARRQAAPVRSWKVASLAAQDTESSNDAGSVERENGACIHVRFEILQLIHIVRQVALLFNLKSQQVGYFRHRK